MDINGRVVLITGGGRGIGREFALVLARRGAKVFAASRSADDVAETVRLVRTGGGIAGGTSADVTDAGQVREMVRRAEEELGPVDVLVNNAGSFRAVGPVWEVDPEAWWGDVSTNMLGSMLCCQAVLPGMRQRGGGIIVNLCGGGADRPFLGASGYGSSKTGLMRLTDTLAFELEQAGCAVQVYGFDPGLVRSRMTENAVSEPAARRWMPKMVEWLEEGADHPVRESAEALARLLEISCPAISGRIFSYSQDFDEIARRAEDIRARDTYQIRYLTHI